MQFKPKSADMFSKVSTSTVKCKLSSNEDTDWVTWGTWFFQVFCNRPIFSEMYKVKFNSVHLRHKKQSTISYDFPAHNEKSSFSCRVTFLKINNGASKAAGNLRKISDDNTQCVVPWSYNTESNIYFSASKKLLS